MTQYFLTVPHDSTAEPTMASMDPAELEAVIASVGALNTALTEAGALVMAGGLHPPSTAVTVDASGDGPPVHTPGPFVEAAEYVGGFWIIEADDHEAALRWTEQCSAAVGGRIELRALQDPPE